MHRSRRTVVLAVALGLTLAACARTAPKTPRMPTVGLQVDPAEPGLAVGQTLLVVAQALMGDGSLKPLDEATWTAANPGIFSIQADKGRAWLTGLREGEAQLLVGALGMTQEVTVRVSAPLPEKLDLTPSTQSQPVGAVAAYVATATLSNGTTVEVTAKATWSISDPSVATPGSNGLKGSFKTAKKGKATVTAAYEKLEARAELVVSGAELVRVDVVPSSLLLPVKTSVGLKAVAVYDDATVADVTDEAVWTSSLPKSATVSTDAPPRGLVTGVAAGEATITATFEAMSGTSTVTVTTAQLTAVEVTPPTLQLAKGTEGELVATALFTDGVPPQDVTAVATWASKDPTIAALGTQPGAVSAKAQGKTEVTATFLGLTGSAQVTVTAATLVSIAVSPAAPTVPKGSVVSFTAAGTYTDGSTQDLTKQVAWTSSNLQVATVSSAAGTEGQALALAPGASTVTAKLDGVSGTAALNVTAAEVVSLVIAPDFSAIAKGTTGTLVATATFTDGSTLDVTDQADWSSSDNQVASITTLGTGRGVVSGVRLGQVTITAAFGGKRATATVVVTPATLTSLTLDPLDPSIAKGTTLQMHATGTYSDGNVQDVTAAVTWSVTDATIAGISNAAATKGLVTALLPGKTTLKASLSGKSAQTTLTVTPAALTKLVVTPASLVLEYKGSQRLTATAYYSDGTQVDVTDTTDWTSADATIAGVTTTGAGRGVVTGNRAGKTTVTASFGGQTVQVPVTVNAPKITKLEIRPSSLSLPAGRKGNLAAWAIYADGSQVEVTLKAQWSSSSANATVDATGLVTGVAQGSATVTALFDGQTATAQILVGAPEVDLLTITPQSAKIPEGGKQKFTVTAVLSDGTTKDVTALAVFTAVDPQGYLSIDKNVVTGVRQGGPVDLVASYGGKTVTAKVTVGPPVTVTSLTISPGSSSIPVGGKQALTVTALLSDGTVQDVTSLALFQSSDRTIADLDANSAVGIAVGGPVTITATYGGKSVTASVRVVAAQLTSIVVQPSGLVLQKGETGQLACIGHYSDGSTKDLTTLCAWDSSDFGIASVSLGAVKGISGGRATVTASYGGMKGTASIVVEAPTLQRLSIVPPNGVLRPNIIYPYRAYATYTDGTVVEVPHDSRLWTIDWVTVAEMYNFTYFGVWAKDAGLTDIQVTYDGAMGASRLQVLNSSLTGLEVTPGKIILPRGTAAKLTGVFAYRSVAAQDGWAVAIQNPDWSSSDPSVLTVGVNGVANAVKAGTANVICTAYDVSGSFKQTVPVTVTSATVTKVDLPDVPPTMVVGMKVQINALATLSDGTTMDLGPSPVVWSLSDSSLAGIAPNPDGVTEILAKKAGSLTISASFGGATASKVVQIVSTALSNLSLVPDQATLPQGSTSKFKVTGTLADSTTIDLTGAATYDSLAPDVAQLGTGLWTSTPYPVILAHAPNNPPEEATLRAKYGGLTATAKVKVTGVNVKSLAVGVNGGAPSTSLVLSGGGPFQLNVTGTFTDGSTADVTAFCTFEPAVPSAPVVPGETVVATVSNAQAGKVTLLGKGTQTLKVTYAPTYIGQPLVATPVSGASRITMTVP